MLLVRARRTDQLVRRLTYLMIVAVLIAWVAR
jgi:hypothetical protein